MILSNEIYNSSQLRGSVGHAVTDTHLLELLSLISSDTADNQIPFPFLPAPEYLRTLRVSESKGRVTIAEGSGKAAPICLITHLLFYLCTFLLFENLHDAWVKSCFLCLGGFFLCRNMNDCCNQSFICNCISHELLLRLDITRVFAFSLVFIFLNYRLKEILLKHV